MDPALRATLTIVAAAMAEARDAWWIIASAAMALHGAAVEVADVDLLASERDAAALIGRLGLASAPAPSPRFRSALFARWEAAPLPVEIMAGFHLRIAGAWRLLLPETRIARPLDGATLFVPDVAELLHHCALFDRPKDRARAAILRQLPD